MTMTRHQTTQRSGMGLGLAVAGHNWSVFLRGAGGRGIAPALGATLVLAPDASDTAASTRRPCLRRLFATR